MFGGAHRAEEKFTKENDRKKNIIRRHWRGSAQEGETPLPLAIQSGPPCELLRTTNRLQGKKRVSQPRAIQRRDGPVSVGGNSQREG